MRQSTRGKPGCQGAWQEGGAARAKSKCPNGGPNQPRWRHRPLVISFGHLAAGQIEDIPALLDARDARRGETLKPTKHEIHLGKLRPPSQGRTLLRWNFSRDVPGNHGKTYRFVVDVLEYSLKMVIEISHERQIKSDGEPGFRLTFA
jgi:hypothetical protein